MTEKRRISSKLKQKANIYDAVSENITQAGFFGHVGDVKGSKQALRPDEVLFRRANAPIRYQEADYYHAHTALAAAERLPSGDLLGALHAYVSNMYARRASSTDSASTWKCMDETALIALGILLEETARQVMSHTGDLALTEGLHEDDEAQMEGAGYQTSEVHESKVMSASDSEISDTTDDSL